MLKFSYIFKLQWLFLAVLSLSLIFSPLSINTSAAPQVIEPPARVNLQRKTFFYDTQASQWREDTNQNATWQTKNCYELYSQGFKGIADYEDGISRNVKKAIENDPQKSNDIFYQQGLSSITSNFADCLEQNQDAKNVDIEFGVTSIHRPKNNTDYSAFYKRQTGDGEPQPFTPANNPVYTYQFEYYYEFPSARRSQLSETYRSKTGLDGDYDGVSWTYTYYTYRDLTTGQYKTWENPNADNSNGGWLIYGIKSDVECLSLECSGLVDPIPVYSTTIQGGFNTPLTLSYDPATKILSFQGDVSVGNSGCWGLGTEHTFVVKPYSDGSYGIFRLLYETVDSGADICTANIPIETLNYSQDMSGLDAKGEEFLINKISENRFTNSEVEGYTGIMPIF